ncbi:hypothetical protein [Streptococcus sp. 20-1249]|uniref:hypothetical protein n=1 Tax=Streptococcus hepaticus TaxID=3349163 RepID=UPI003748F190
MEQIRITGTETTIISSRIDRTFVIAGHLAEKWKFRTLFEKVYDGPSLDENGDLFEPVYDLVLEAEPLMPIVIDSSYSAKDRKKDMDEIQKVFAFIEDNKKNIFESLGIQGVIE